MHRVIKIATGDGKHFDSEKEARRYLDKEYGNRLTSIAHKIVRTDCKYTQLCEFLDTNLNLFQELIDLKNELKNGIKEEELE